MEKMKVYKMKDCEESERASIKGKLFCRRLEGREEEERDQCISEEENKVSIELLAGIKNHIFICF